jgi:hypothetical protein
MSDRWEVRVQAKCSPMSSRLGVGRWANNSIPEKSTATKHLDSVEDAKNHTGL